VATIQLHLFLGFFADLAVSVCLCIVVAVRKTFAPFLIGGRAPYISSVTPKVTKLGKFAEFREKLFVAGFVWPRAID
jgi:hypothetical protein